MQRFAARCKQMLVPSETHSPTNAHGPAPLLGWQTLFLSYVLGVLASAQPPPALLGLGLLLGLDWPRFRAARRIPALLFCFALGVSAGWLSSPQTLAHPRALHDERVSQGKFLIQGRVRAVEGRPGRRLNILLDEVLCRTDQPEAGEAVEGSSPGHDRRFSLPGALLWTWENPAFPPEPGALIEARVRVIPAHGFANPGGWDYEAYLARSGVFYRAYGASEKTPPTMLEPGDAPLWRWRQRAIDATLAVMRAQDAGMPLTPGKALLMTFLFGDRYHLDARTLDLMQRASLSHTLALSGQNLGYMVFTAWLLAYGMGLLWPGVFLRVNRPRLVVLIAAPLATLYLWLGGAPPSLIRAYVMLVFWGVLLWRGRGRILLDGLLQALLCMLVIQPGLVFDLGLQLSAGAVAGLALYLDCAPLLRERLLAALGRMRALFTALLPVPSEAQRQRRLARALAAKGDAPPPGFWSLLPGRLCRGAFELFCLSLAAQIAILPLLVWSFGQLSPQLYLNVLWLPFQGLLVQPLGMLGLCLLPLPALAGALLGWAADLLDAGVRLLAWLDSADALTPYIPLRPDWPAWIGYWTLLVWGLFLVRDGLRPRAAQQPRAFLALAPALGLLLLAWPTLAKTIDLVAHPVTLTLLDVGQGQAALLEYGGGRRALIDGGGLRSSTFDVGAAVVLPALTLRSPPRLDLAVLSHPDFDHARGLVYPLRVADARLFAWSGLEAASQELASIKQIVENRGVPTRFWTAGQRIMLSEELWFDVLHPRADFVSENTNEASLVLRLSWKGEGLALLPGDAGQRAMDQFLRAASAKSLPVQVLILPHHGSGKELREDLYELTAPELALASAGYRNQWGFPSSRVREALAARAIPLACTSENGAITVRWSRPLHRTVTTARPPGR
jgi:competence protein ComEC